MSDQINTQSALQRTPIAIIGMAGVFPQAENLQEYWDNIVKEVDSITDVPPSRWKIEDYYDPDPTVPDKTYCKRGGFLPDIDFNPMEFGLPPNILEVTDVSQLLSLVVAKQAMKDAGYGEDVEFNRAKTGVVLGVGGGQKLITPLTARLQYPVWDRVLESSGVAEADRAQIVEKMKKAYIHWEENSFPGMLGNVISGRVANRLDLGGMNCVVDAACAASLAAIKMAVTELTDYRADTMITGGVDTDNSIFMYMSFSKTPAFSKNNEIRPFDVNSDGMMIGEGVGMLVLKRLEDAQRDGDRIYAVIKGVGTSSDGRYKSIYAPRASGQALAVNRAYEDAGFTPATVGLVEAHGTGTPAGDPTEFAGLNEVFSHNNPNKQHIALGSVKSQIGHTKAAAGAASLIKTALALYHRILPPTLNVSLPNPKMDIENSPFYLNTHTRPWLPPQTGTPRRAGVSAFGFGGTNFHFVLEEYNGEPTNTYRLHKTPEDVFITAPSTAQLINKCEALLIAMQADEGVAQYRELVLASQTPNIPTESARIGFVSDSLPQAIELLQTAVNLLKSNPTSNWEHPKGIFYRQTGIAAKGKVVAIFPGQGSQYLEMGKELSLNFPPIRDTYGQMDALFVADGQAPLSNILFPIPVFSDEERKVQADTLRRTEFVQPAIGAFSVGLYKLLQQAGFTPDFTAGHSFGELIALWAGGVLDDATFYYLAKARGQAMAAPGGPSIDTGTMVAVKGNIAQLQQDIQGMAGVTIANYNSTEQVVLAGSKAAMQNAEQQLSAKGYVVTPLPVSAAFHTEFVGHAQQPFSQAIERAQFNAPRIAVYSNSSAQPYSDQPNQIKTMLKDHILNPVLFSQEIENIYAAGGSVFVEIGPKRVLTNLVKNILGDRPHIAVAVNASSRKGSDRQLREAYVQLCVAGLPLRALDPYSREYNAPTSYKKTPINVNLSGNNYVSPKTEKAYVAALQDGQMITATNNQQSTNATESSSALSTQHSAPSTPPSTPKIEPKEITKMSKPSPRQERIEKSLDLLHEHQAETARVHETYLKGQETFAQSVVQLMQQVQVENKGAVPVTSPPTTPTPAPASNGNQNGTSNGFIAPPKPTISAPTIPAPAPVAPAPAAPQPMVNTSVAVVAEPITAVSTPALAPQPQVAQPPAPSVNVAELAQAMLIIVSEKTGYPAEMLEMSMDMESDLGIDSIKRVEILGAMQEQHLELPEVNPNELAELRTLQQIVDHLSGAVAGESSMVVSEAAPSPQPPASSPQPQVAQPPAPSNNGANLEALAQAMLIIVSEKTGYPAEMLEMSMDMESDLGIDSIKRVEILGAMQEQHPELPEVNPNELAELRTLQQIVDHLSGAVAGESVPSPQPPATSNQQPATSPQPQVAQPPAPSNNGANIEALSQAMLIVVSEKTGYPVEMLEMSMDMESDLGIDSIKRVEILGAMQEQHPELPEVNPNELAELRTLQQIVDHLSGAVASESPMAVSDVVVSEPVTAPDPSPQPPDPSNNGANIEALSQAMLIVVSEKTGYPVEMLEMSMDMESDLGIDSIKRVEILGAMQERHPDLPEVNPNELAELRTLQQIVDHLGTNLKKADPATAGAGSSTNSNRVPAPINHAITRNIVQLKSLPMPDYLEYSLPETAVCLLTDEGTEKTTVVAQSLLNRGWKVAVLSLPPSVVPTQATLPAGVGRVILADLSEPHLAAQLTAVSQQLGTIGSFIHLQPSNAEAALKLVFFIAKHLKEALTTAAAQQERASFITVTQLDGALGLDGTTPFNPINGGLFGLTKTLNLEWTHVFCRAIDIHPSYNAEQTAAYLLAELHDPNRLISEVGYGNRGRVTLETIEAPMTPYTPNREITPDSLFVVSGGAKGITADCVIHLAKQYRCKFALLGRSSIADVDTSWLSDYADEAALKRQIMERIIAQGEKPTPMLINKMARAIASKRAIETTLNIVRQAGSQVEYISVDVTDRVAMGQALTAVSTKLGTITGIIHGAGVLSDKLIEKKTEQDFNSVYATKIAGLDALLTTVPPQQLQHLVLFSSAAGFYGNVGQADYALANEILNKTAHLIQHQHPNCRVISIDWGPWDGGMVTPALKKMFVERNIELIPIEVGTWLLANELTAENNHVTQTVVGGALAFPEEEITRALQTHRIHRYLSVAANPFLQDHVIGGNAVLPTVNAIAWMGNVCEQLYPGTTFFSCDNYQVLKGIVFDENHPENKAYILELQETEKGNGRITFKAMVSSQNEAGKPRFHYRAEITLLTQLPDAPIYSNFDPTESNPIPKAELYQSGTLFHGPAYQGIEQLLNISPQKVTMRCQLAPLSDVKQGQFQVQSFNPYIADGQFQSMVIWARHLHDAGSLPLHTVRGEQFRPIPFGVTTYVSMEVKESSESKLVADILTHDENGRLYARVLGAEVTISKQLNHLFVPAQ